MYILKCANHKFYTGSTKNLERRLNQHQSGQGANFTKKHLPVELVYSETFERIDWAFYREKQIQGWSYKKKEALINGDLAKLKELSRSKSADFDRLNQHGPQKNRNELAEFIEVSFTY